MSWRSLQVRCKDCGTKTDLIIPKKEYEAGVYPICPECEGPVEKLIGTPMVMTASFPDGTKRKGFDDGKEAYKILSEGYNLPPEKRKGHLKEFKKITGKEPE